MKYTGIKHGILSSVLIRHKAVLGVYFRLGQLLPHVSDFASKAE